MPLKRGSSQKTISSNIAELHAGNTYKRTAAKFGPGRANAQAIAIAMRQAGKARPRKRQRTIAEGY